MIMHNHHTQLLFTFCFVVMFTLTGLCKLHNSSRLFNAKGIFAKNIKLLIGLHIAGIFFFGVLPALFFPQQFAELVTINFRPATSSLFLFIFLFLLVGCTALHEGTKILNGSSQGYLLSNKLLIHYFIARILFLCAYEMFFRGLLLSSFTEWYGVAAAIMISTGLTVFIHVFTNEKELLGCIPFGLILCSYCISVQTVWVAILIHITLSLFYEIPVVNHLSIKLKPAR